MFYIFSKEQMPDSLPNLRTLYQRQENFEQTHHVDYFFAVYEHVVQFYRDKLGITVKDTFTKRMEKWFTTKYFASLSAKERYMLLRKISVLFGGQRKANPGKKVDTGSFTGMMGPHLATTTMNTLCGISASDLRILTSLSYFSSVTGMQAGRGLPVLDELAKLWHLCGKDPDKLRKISALQIGIPDEETIMKILLS